MKKIISFICICLLTVFMSTQTYAHSHLKDSSPKADELVTTEMNTISVNFDGKIMEGSYLQVKSSDGTVIEPVENVIGDGVLTATFAEPFITDQYDVHWNIISADGHPLEGDYSFSVQYEIPEVTTDEQSEDVVQKENVSKTPEVEKSDSSSVVVYIILGIAIIIVIASVLLLRKRKK